MLWKINREAKRAKSKEISNVIYCGGLLSVFKNVDHRGYCAILKLCNDLETNHGPPINRSLTIKTPYSQGDVTIFGTNCRTAMCLNLSLCALVYNNIRGINNYNDLVQIMNMGNELYSILS